MRRGVTACLQSVNIDTSVVRTSMADMLGDKDLCPKNLSLVVGVNDKLALGTIPKEGNLLWASDLVCRSAHKLRTVYIVTIWIRY